jgi:hypothetical protein
VSEQGYVIDLAEIADDVPMARGTFLDILISFRTGRQKTEPPFPLSIPIPGISQPLQLTDGGTTPILDRTIKKSALLGEPTAPELRIDVTKVQIIFELQWREQNFLYLLKDLSTMNERLQKATGWLLPITWIGFFVVAIILAEGDSIKGWSGFLLIIPGVIIPMFLFGPLSPPAGKDKSILIAVLYFIGCSICLVCGRYFL